MQSKGKKNFTILGVLLLALTGAAFVWYEWAGGREFVNYSEVVVLKEDVLKGQKITSEQLTVKKVEKTSLIKEVVSDSEEIIGKEARHFIPAATQLHASYFDEAGLVLKEKQVIAQIPVEWTLSVPDTLRRGDNIVIYAALYDKQLLASLQTASSKQTTVTSSNPNDSITSENQETETQVVITPTTSTQDASQQKKFEEVLSAKVAYVKDSSNQEVVTVSTNDRLNATSVISNVEIVTTPKEFKRIEEKINQGGKLVIMYSDEELIETENETE